MPDYYDIHYREYFEKTAHLDPSPFLNPVLEFLHEGSEILDIGCGSGRDMAWLKSRGFKPTGFEKSAGMAGLARKKSGCNVVEGDFLDHDFSIYRADAVILSACLVHQPHDRLPSILERIKTALKKPGYIYISLKHGNGEKTDGAGRKFYLWQDNDLRTVFGVLYLETVFYTLTPSARGTSEVWLNYILKN